MGFQILFRAIVVSQIKSHVLLEAEGYLFPYN